MKVDIQLYAPWSRTWSNLSTSLTSYKYWASPAISSVMSLFLNSAKHCHNSEWWMIPRLQIQPLISNAISQDPIISIQRHSPGKCFSKCSSSQRVGEEFPTMAVFLPPFISSIVHSYNCSISPEFSMSVSSYLWEPSPFFPAVVFLFLMPTGERSTL